MFMRMIYDEKLAQAAYLIGCPRSGEAVIVDPQRDVDRYVELAADHELRITAVAETHVHADFVSGARELATREGATVLVSGEGGSDWTPRWLEGHEHRVLHDGDVFTVGSVELRAVHTPGHTPEHLAYLVTDRGGGANEPIGLLSGDFLFVGDLGRPDLLETAAGRQGDMEPSARRLHASARRLADLPDFVQVWPGHGAGTACGKALGSVPASTVGYERRFNAALRLAGDEQAFVDAILEGQPEPPLYFARMKRVNVEGPPVLGGLPLPPRITAADLRAIDAARTAIVDTRPWEAFRVAHVPRSLSFPLTRSFNTDAGSMIGGDEPIVLVIEPARVEEAVRDLLRIGLDRITGWLDASELEQYEDGEHRLADLPELTAPEAAAELDDRAARPLDVRRATEFAEGHVPGAVNIAHTRLAGRLDEVPRGARLIVNCRTGRRSARATAYLRRLGHDAANLRGGFLAWQQAQSLRST